jgi:hypothetical protein
MVRKITPCPRKNVNWPCFVYVTHINFGFVLHNLLKISYVFFRRFFRVKRCAKFSAQIRNPNIETLNNVKIPMFKCSKH